MVLAALVSIAPVVAEAQSTNSWNVSPENRARAMQIINNIGSIVPDPTPDGEKCVLISLANSQLRREGTLGSMAMEIGKCTDLREFSRMGQPLTAVLTVQEAVGVLGAVLEANPGPVTGPR